MRKRLWLLPMMVVISMVHGLRRWTSIANHPAVEPIGEACQWWER